jgi:hypothetical protein
MDLDQISREGRLPRRIFLRTAGVLGIGALILPSCTREIIVTPGGEDNGDDPYNPPPSQTYNNLSGEWGISSKNNFGNNDFTSSLSVNSLNITQRNNLAPGYSQDVYELVGNFTGFTWSMQRKSNGQLYLVYQNASGNIIGGGININHPSKLIEFYLGSQNYRVRGVAPGYESMWGDLYLTINMNSVFGESDGTIVLTGDWEGERK